MARDDLHFRLRIPEGLKLRVEKSAKDNRRSMTAEIVATLGEKYPEPTMTFEEIVGRVQAELTITGGGDDSAGHVIDIVKEANDDLESIGDPRRCVVGDDGLSVVLVLKAAT